MKRSYSDIESDDTSCKLGQKLRKLVETHPSRRWRVDEKFKNKLSQKTIVDIDKWYNKNYEWFVKLIESRKEQIIGNAKSGNSFSRFEKIYDPNDEVRYLQYHIPQLEKELSDHFDCTVGLVVHADSVFRGFDQFDIEYRCEIIIISV